MICDYCKNEIPDEARKCGHCGEYTSGVVCDECYSTLPAKASVCRCCGSKVKRKAGAKTDISLDIRGRVLPSLIFRFRLLPHEIVADNEKVVINTPGLFRLWNNADEIPWNKVAGFTYRSGIIWDRVEIETRGQKPSVVIGIDKMEGPRLREILQNLER
jgi:ribosomal protein L40E